jgi:hypothetical protein
VDFLYLGAAGANDLLVEPVGAPHVDDQVAVGKVLKHGVRPGQCNEWSVLGIRKQVKKKRERKEESGREEKRREEKRREEKRREEKRERERERERERNRYVQ